MTIPRYSSGRGGGGRRDGSKREEARRASLARARCGGQTARPADRREIPLVPCLSRRRARGMDGRGKMQNEDRPLTVRCAPALNAPLTRVQTRRRICFFFLRLASRSQLLPGGVLLLFIFSFFSRARERAGRSVTPVGIVGHALQETRRERGSGERTWGSSLESGTKATSQIYRKLCVVQ